MLAPLAQVQAALSRLETTLAVEPVVTGLRAGADARSARLQRTSGPTFPRPPGSLRLPVLTARTLADELDISHHAALRPVAQLGSLGLLGGGCPVISWPAQRDASRGHASIGG